MVMALMNKVMLYFDVNMAVIVVTGLNCSVNVVRVRILYCYCICGMIVRIFIMVYFLYCF